MREKAQFNRRIHQAILPVTERYVHESGRPDRCFAAPFSRRGRLFDYTKTHFVAHPLPLATEKAARVIVSKIVGIPGEVLDDALVAAFAERADEIIEYRRHGKLVQLVDHTPSQAPVGTQFAENLALVDHVKGVTKGHRLRGLIKKSHGIGTVGYRPLKVRVAPKAPGIRIGTLARMLTHTHYSIPSTDQYADLELEREDRRRYTRCFSKSFKMAMTAKKRLENSGSKPRPRDLYQECVINPVGTKDLRKDGVVTIPRAKRETRMLLGAMEAGILPVYTAFKFDENGKIIACHCEVGAIIPEEKVTSDVIDQYLTAQAAFRTKHSDETVVYANK